MSADYQSLYSQTRGRIAELVSDLDDAVVAEPVPATPEWSMTDVIAHLAGILADIRAGNLEGVATDPWTAKQVEARRGKPMPELIDEWSENATAIEPLLPNFPPQGAAQLCADVYTHEQDIRGALGAPGMREGPAFENAIDFFGGWLRSELEQRDMGLCVSAGEHRWETGAADTTLTADPFELLRAYAGRRSPQQIRSWGWSGDPEPYLPLLSPFGLRSDPLVE